MANEKVLGVDVLVTIGGVTVGSQRDASLKITAKEIDTSDKTTGGFDTSLAGNRSWSITCDCVALDSDSGQDALVAAVLAGSAVTAAFVHGAGRTYTGSAVVTNFELTGSKDDVSTAKFELKGAGALA